MGEVGAVVGAVSFMAIMAGLAMFLPVSNWRSKRSLAKKLILGGTVSFVFALIITPSPANNPAGPATQPMPATASAKSSDRMPVDPAARTKLITAQAKMTWREIVSVARPCEEAGRSLAAASETRDLYAMFDSAKAAEARCDEASAQTQLVGTPASLTGEAQLAFKDGVSICARGLSAKARAYERFAQVLDGDMKPSSVAEARSFLETASGAGIVCAMDMFTAASKAGIDTAIFDKIAK